MTKNEEIVGNLLYLSKHGTIGEMVKVIEDAKKESYNEALTDVLKGAEEQNDHGLTYDTVDREYIESLFKK